MIYQKKIIGTVISTLITAVIPTVGWASSGGVYVNGNILKQRIASGDGGNYMYALGFIVGVHDSHSGNLICGPDGVTPKQLLEVVNKYMAENPEGLHLSAFSIVGAALHKAFPCKIGSSK